MIPPASSLGKTGPLGWSHPLALLLAFFVFACASAFAQTATEEPRPPKLRFLFLDETDGYYSLKLGNVYRQLSANPYEVSSPFNPTDFKPLDIYKNLPDSSTGLIKPIKIASVTPPSKTTSTLVIITPRPSATPTEPPVYSVEFIDSDPSNFPARSIRIINRSPVALAAQFSDTRILAMPGEVSLVQPTTDSRNRAFFKIAIQVQEKSGWQLIEDSITVIRPTERMVGLLVYSPGGMRHMLTAAEIAEFGSPKPGCFWLTYSEAP
jgi:hypothetical protein